MRSRLHHLSCVAATLLLCLSSPQKLLGITRDSDVLAQTPTAPYRMFVAENGNDQPPLPSVFVSSDPKQAVTPAVIVRINAALASQGLFPASCSTKSVAVFTVNNLYTACAYPTSAFPAGNYKATVPLEHNQTTPDRKFEAGGRNEQTPLPSVFVSSDPKQAVPSAAMVKINAVFARRGLTLTSCSANPVVVFTLNNLFTACAHPTSAFPAGNYEATIPGL